MLCPRCAILRTTHQAKPGEWMRMNSARPMSRVRYCENAECAGVFFARDFQPDRDHVLVDYGVEQARGRGNAGGATYQEPSEELEP